MFCATAGLSIVLGSVLSRYREKDQCLRRLHALQAAISYEHQKTSDGNGFVDGPIPGNRFLKSVLGERYAATPCEVLLHESPLSSEFTEDDAKLLLSINDLRWLSLQGTSITDEGLACLYHLQRLERLDLEGSKVTSKGVAKLKEVMKHVSVYSDVAISASDQSGSTTR